MPFRSPSASLHHILKHLRCPLVPRRSNLKYCCRSLTPLCHPSAHLRRHSTPLHCPLPPLHRHLPRFRHPLTPFRRPLMHLHHQITPVRPPFIPQQSQSEQRSDLTFMTLQSVVVVVVNHFFTSLFGTKGLLIDITIKTL